MVHSPALLTMRGSSCWQRRDRHSLIHSRYFLRLADLHQHQLMECPSDYHLILVVGMLIPTLQLPSKRLLRNSPNLVQAFTMSTPTSPFATEHCGSRCGESLWLLITVILLKNINQSWIHWWCGSFNLVKRLVPQMLSAWKLKGPISGIAPPLHYMITMF